MGRRRARRRGRRRGRRYRRRRFLVGGATMLLVGGAAYKLGQNNVDQIEEYTGKPADELTEQELESAMNELDIQEEEITDADLIETASELETAVGILDVAEGLDDLEIAEAVGEASRATLAAGAIGIVFGLLFGAGWIVAGAVSGTAVGMFDKGIKDKLLKELGENMTPEESALAALVVEADWQTLRDRMQAENFNGEIVVSELVPEHMAGAWRVC